MNVLEAEGGRRREPETEERRAQANFEIAHHLPGAIWSEAAENRWLMRPRDDRLAVALASWKSDGWNRYAVRVVGSTYNVSVK